MNKSEILENTLKLILRHFVKSGDTAQSKEAASYLDLFNEQVAQDEAPVEKPAKTAAPVKPVHTDDAK